MNISFFNRRAPRRLVSARYQAGLNRARLQLEQLELRTLLAIDSAVAVGNFNRCDVNHDGHVSALDALQVINYLNAHGSQKVGAPTASPMSMASMALAGTNSTGSSTSPSANFDVNKDGTISPLDALIVINQLNDPTLVNIRLATTDLSGNPISQIVQGQDFLLKAFVQDVRTDVQPPDSGGVFSAFTDITFDPSLAQFDGNPSFASPYVVGTTADLSTPGIINEVGATSQQIQPPLGPSERLLFSEQMKATSGGSLTFTADPADLQGHDVLLYGVDTAIPTTEVAYGSTTLQIVPFPTLTIGDVQKAEGNSGSTSFDFPVTLSAPFNQDVSVQYTTSDGTATAGSDYVGVSQPQTLTIPAGQTTGTISIPVNGDLLNENDETFFVNLANPVNVLLENGQATGTILNDDPVPTLSIDDVSHPEGNSGTTPFVFTVSLSAASGLPITVNYQTFDQSATTLDNDYVATSGSLTFNPGETSHTITVNAKGDTTYEIDETFQVQLSGNTNATLAKGVGIGTIANDDPPPTITIADPAPVTEPATGSTPLNFAVSLSQAAERTVTVHYETVSNTATSGADFEPVSGTVTFTVGQTQATIAVPIDADSISEPDETFFVQLSDATNGTIARAQATGTIRDLVLNKEARVRFAFTDLSGTPITQVVGGQPFLLNVYVQDVRADLDPNNAGVFEAYVDAAFDPTQLSVDSLIQGVDANSVYINGLSGSFDNTAGSITDVGGIATPITPLGTSEQLLFKAEMTGLAAGTAQITGSASAVAGHELLLYGDNAAIPPAAIQFLNASIDVLPPSLITVADSSLVESTSGITNMPFTVNLQRQDNNTVTVHYATSAGTAVPGADYNDISGTLTFGPGDTQETILVPVIGSTLSKGNRTFFLNLSQPTDAVVAPGSQQVVGTIIDPNPLPTLSVGDASATELPGAMATFTVSLSTASGQTVKVNYATANGTATAGIDYTAVSGTLTFDPGQTSKTVSVPVLHDLALDGSETFFLNLSSPQAAILAEGHGTATINDIALASIGGFVYGDANSDGVKDGNDPGLGGITIHLAGTDIFGTAVNLTQQSSSNGSYQFSSLQPGTYKVNLVQPPMLSHLADNLGNAGGAITAPGEFTITIGAGINAAGYNFGEGGLSALLNGNLFFASSLTGHTGT